MVKTNKYFISITTEDKKKYNENDIHYAIYRMIEDDCIIQIKKIKK